MKMIYWLTNSDDVQLLSQVTTTDKPDYEQLIAIKATNFGARPFGFEYTVIKVVADKETAKKKHRADVCAVGFSPFLIFSARAGHELANHLVDAGERLAIDSPWPDYFGFHLILELKGAVDLSQSDYKMYGDQVVVRKAAIRFDAVGAHAIFRVEEQPSNVYVTEEFKLAFERGNLKGAKFLPVRGV
jgi:hypothetical protein